ncbi:MAG: hypothetical protein RIE77_01700 [Phycisphaerales bacterium]|jgi:hypothetical protein
MICVLLGLLAGSQSGCQEVVLDERPKNDLFGRLSGAPRERSDAVSPRRGVDPASLPPIREELPDGEIVLRARTGRDLMAHLQHALIHDDEPLERELFTEHLLSEATRAEYEARSLPPDQAYYTLLRRRDDVLLLFNRIGPLAENSPQVIMKSLGNNVIRLQVTGLAREGLRWSFMDMIFEDGNWRLRWFG